MRRGLMCYVQCHSLLYVFYGIAWIEDVLGAGGNRHILGGLVFQPRP